MTALLGVAVLGLVPLPSMAPSSSRPSRFGPWLARGEAAISTRPVRAPQAIVDGTATPEELARKRHELAGVDANMTRSGFLGDAMKTLVRKSRLGYAART